MVDFWTNQNAAKLEFSIERPSAYLLYLFKGLFKGLGLSRYHKGRGGGVRDCKVRRSTTTTVI